MRDVRGERAQPVGLAFPEPARARAGDAQHGVHPALEVGQGPRGEEAQAPGERREAGVRRFAETGPGKVVTGLVRRTLPDVEAFAAKPEADHA